MTITARYPGRCATCGGPIKAGTKIEWSKGGGARHVGCATQTSAPAAAPARMAQPARGTCAHCGDRCNPRYRTCIECAHGGQSYTDRHGNFILGSDD